jgi:hypothetical protein
MVTPMEISGPSIPVLDVHPSIPTDTWKSVLEKELFHTSTAK